MIIFVICVLVALTIVLRVFNDKMIRNLAFDAAYFMIIVALFIHKMKEIHIDLEVLEFAGMLAILIVFGVFVIRDFVKKQ